MTGNGKLNIELEGVFALHVRRLAIAMGVTHETVIQMGISNLAASPLALSISENTLQSGSEGPESTEESLLSRVDIQKYVRDKPAESEVLATEILHEHENQYSPYRDRCFGIHRDEIDFSMANVWAVDENPPPETHYFLWGQFSRFLPIKWTLRELAKIFAKKEGPPTLKEWQSYSLGWEMREYLRELDVGLGLKRGEQMASGFPRDTPKSNQRFQRHYCADLFSNGQLVGLPAHLGLIVLDEQGCIRFTPRGIAYLEAENPILDEKLGAPYRHLIPTPGPMGPEEKLIILEAIQKHLPTEYRFMYNVLRWILAGNNTTDLLNQKIWETYGEGTVTNWNREQASTYRGGAIGRLGEMKLISRSWKFRNVTYTVEKEWAVLPHPDEVVE